MLPGALGPALLVLKLQEATCNVGKTKMRKWGRRKMYFCKRAPHKSDKQWNRDEAERGDTCKERRDDGTRKLSGM